MEPIISPWIIYTVSLAGKISTVAAILAVILGTCLAVTLVMYIVEYHEEDDTAKKIFKKTLIPFAVCVAVLVFVPDRTTMMSMIVVQYITPDNISAVQGNVLDFVGQIVQAVKENVK